MAKYKLQIAEQRKKILSRERRNQERTRLNQRADVVNKRERTIFEKRIIELNNACDDVEDGKYIQSERESVHRVMESNADDISIPPPSFELVSLSLSPSPLSKIPKQVFFNPYKYIWTSFYHTLIIKIY